jgi:hypothetical protein
MAKAATVSTAITIATLAGHAAEIKRLGKRAVADIIEIGKLLSEAKRIAGRVDFLPWLEHEFGWSEDTAENFIRLSKLSHEIPKFSELNIPLSGLYLLAAPSTAVEARNEIVERAQAGEPVSRAEVKETIEAAKGRQQPAKRTRGSRGNPTTFRAMKLGDDVMAKIKGTSLDSAREWTS